MFVCPKCQSLLTQEELLAQRCSSCNQPWEGSPLKASEQSDVETLETIDLSDFQQGADATVDESAEKAESLETIDIEGSDEQELVELIYDDDADPKLADPDDADPVEPLIQDQLGTTVSSTDPNATVKSGAEEADDGDFDLEEVLAETVKSDTEPSAEVESLAEEDASHRTASAAGDATIDFDSQAGHLDQESEIARALGTHWMSVSAEDTTPTITIQSKYQVDEPKVESITPERTLKSKDNSAAEDPDYEIISYAAEGSMGQVFLARQNSVQRIVAIKQLKDELAQKSSYRKKFLAEASVTGVLDHPNIVPVHDLGVSQDGQLFYSMKMVRGQSWQSEIKTNTRAENLDILLRVSDAVAYAHSKQVIHRDLKPENIMLGSFGEVLVADWGVAVHLDRERNFGLAGTPAYMAPEMASGPPEALGTHSDIYLLGAMLFEIVVGKAPHHLSDSTNQVLVHAAANNIVETDIQDELLTIARRAMATLPARRYPTVEAFKEAVREYQTHTESLAILSRAENELAEARETGELESYARSVFGFQDAIELWSGNTRAYSGLHEAKQAYAEAALKAENFELGIAQLDASDERNHTLLGKLEKGKKDRAQRARRLKVARRSAVALLSALLIGATAASLKFRSDANTIAEKQGTITTQNQQLQQTNSQLNETNEKLNETNEQLDETIVDLNQKNVELDEERERLVKANTTIAGQQADLIDKNEKLEVATAKAISEQLRAERGEQAAIQGQFISQVALTKSLIDENEFSRPREQLDNLANSEILGKLRDWEWERLHFLTHPEVSSLPSPRGLAAGETPAEATAIAATQDGKTIAAARRGGVLQLYRRSDKGIVEVRTLQTSQMKVDSLAFSKAGDRLAAGGQSGGDRGRPVLMVFDLNSESDQPEFQVSASEYWKAGGDTSLAKSPPAVKSVDFHPARNDTLLVAGYAPHALLFQRSTSGQWQVVEKLPHWTRLEEARFNSNGTAVAVVPETDVAKHRKIFVWKLEGNQSAGSPVESPSGEYHRVTFPPNNPEIVVFSDERGVVRFWNWSRDRIAPYQLEGHERAVNAIAFSPDGASLVSGSRDNLLRIWQRDATAGESGSASKESGLSWTPLETTPYLRGHEGPIVQCLFLDAKSILSLDNKGKTKIWDYQSYFDQIEIVATDNRAPCPQATFDAQANTVATAGRDGSVKFWHGPNRVGVGKAMTGPALRVGHPAFTGQEISFHARVMPLPGSGGEGLVTYLTKKPVKGESQPASLAIWELATGRCLHEQTVNAGEYFDASADFPLMVIGQRVEPQRVDYLRVVGQPELTIRSFRESSEENARTAAFVPGSRKLFLGMTNQRGKLVAVEGESQMTEKYLPKNMIGAAFTPQGDRLLTIQDKQVTTQNELQQLGRLVMSDLKVGRSVTKIDLTDGASFLLEVAKGDNANRAIVVAHPSGLEPGAAGSDLTLVQLKQDSLENLRSVQGCFLSAAISPDGKTVVTLTKRPEGIREDLRDAEQETSLQVWSDDLALSEEHPLSQTIARTNPSALALLDEDRLLTYGINHNGKYAAHVWDLPSKQELARMTSGSAVLATQILDGGRRVVSVAENGVLYVWDRADAQRPRLERQMFAPGIYNLSAASISPSGRFAVVVDVLGEAAILDIEAGTSQSVQLEGSYVVDADCSATNLAVLFGDGRVKVGQGLGGQLEWLPGEPVSEEGAAKSVRMSRDGQAVACYLEHSKTGRDIAFWRIDPKDGATWQKPYFAKRNDSELELPDVSAMAFSGALFGQPNRRLIVGDAFGSLSVMQVNWPESVEAEPQQVDQAFGEDAEEDGSGLFSLRELFRWRGHAQEVLSVEFSADGKHLMSTSRRGEAKIWPTQQPDDAAEEAPGDLDLTSVFLGTGSSKKEFSTASFPAILLEPFDQKIDR